MSKRFLTNKDNIENCPTGKDHYWAVIKKDPRFPKPLQGMGNRTEFYNPNEMNAFWDEVSKTGIHTKETENSASLSEIK